MKSPTASYETVYYMIYVWDVIAAAIFVDPLQ